MNYSKKIKAAVTNGPKTLGIQVLLWAIDKEFSIERISKCLDVSRQAIYGWVKGREISVSRRARAIELLHILHDSDTAEQAWETAQKTFNLEA
jgi:predicted DNA-binding protein YlxM (UPF0122 family)